MKPKQLFLSLLILLFSGGTVRADSISEVKAFSPWDKYDEYTFEGFKRYGPANEPIDFSGIDYPLLNAAVFYETNRRRQQYGLEPYIHSDALERAAFMHSIDMSRNDFFSHRNSGDSRKREPSDRTALFGGGPAGENIATTFGIQYEAGTPVRSISAIPPHTYNSFAEALVEGWMESPGHKANILDERGHGYQYLGCGAYAVSGDEWRMFNATQNFSSSGEGASGEPERAAAAGSGSNGGTGQGSSTAASETGSSGEGYTLERNNLLVARGGSVWLQLDSGGGELFAYSEEGRDENYIYLRDDSRNLHLAVPVHGGKLYYKYDGGSWEYWLVTKPAF